MDITLSESILILRRRKGWSQDNLADKSGLSRNIISMVERDATNATLETLKSIFLALEHEYLLRLGAKGME